MSDLKDYSSNMLPDESYNGTIFNWEEGLKIPLWLWVKPCLSLLNLPEAIVKQPLNLKDLRQQLRDGYETSFQALIKRVGFERATREESKILHASVTLMLEELARRTSKQTAADFELWLRRHFISSEIKTALNTWGYFFNITYDSDYPKPTFLIPHYSKLSFRERDRVKKLEEEIIRLAPLPPPEDIEAGLVPSIEALTILGILTTEETIRSLDILSNSFDLVEREEFMEWVRDTSVSNDLQIEDMQVERCLQNPKLWFDIPIISSATL